ncbi:MAG TPA: hypothetical protein VF857_09790 [Spirochaetota bacterium]
MRSLFLSVVSLGLGEIRNGDPGKGFIVIAARLFVLLAPGVYLYARSDQALYFCSVSALIIVVTSFYSPYAAFCGAGKRHIRSWWQSPFALAIWGTIQWGLTLCAGCVFLVLFPVVKLHDNMGYPAYPDNRIILSSVRQPQSYNENDVVLVARNKILVPMRIISKDEGSYVDYLNGKISILGSDLPQTVRTAQELAALGYPNDENIFAESHQAMNYCIARKSGKSDGKAERFVVSKDEVFVCPDNRVDGKPSVISRNEIVSRVEWIVPLPWRKMHD